MPLRPRLRLASLAVAVVVAVGAPVSAASASVDARPERLSLPGRLAVEAVCPPGHQYESATVDIAALGRRLVVHADGGRVRTAVDLVAPRGAELDRVRVDVTCVADDGGRHAAGSARVRVIAAGGAGRVGEATPVAESAAEEGEPVSSVVPLTAFALVSLGAFLTFGLVGRASREGQRGDPSPRRVRR